MPNFLENYKMSKIYADLTAAVQEQYKNGVVTESEIIKFIELVKDENKLKLALNFL